jgi:membrane protein implicated in regulation of membrane protease activity
MTWADVYLICFIVGFSLSLISALSGLFHIPGLHHHGHHGHVHLKHGHAGAPGQVSPLNFTTITAFLAWFGGVGYLLTTLSSIWIVFAFLLAAGAGVIGASIVFLFLVKVLLAHDKPMNPLDYEMVGVLGQLTSPIREGGIGEMSFRRDGGRQSSAARSEDGSAIAKGTEVVVTRYEKGVAYVRRWEDLNELKETL